MTAATCTPDLVIPGDADRTTWLEARREGLGASDAAAICGLSPWRGRFEVWAEKVGSKDVLADDGATEAMLWGQLLEPAIVDRYREETGRSVTYKPGMYRHGDVEWMLATPDALAGKLGIEADPVRWPYSDSLQDDLDAVEAKNVSTYKRDEWEDRPPKHYLIQVQHALAVLDWPRATLAVLFGGNRYRQFDVERDDEAIETLLQIEEDFWGLVQRREEPPIDGSASTARALRDLYASVDPGAEVELPPEALKELAGYWTAHDAIEGLKEQKQAHANQLQAWLKDAETGLLDGEPAVTWKPQTSKRVDVTALRKGRPEVAAEFETEKTQRVLRPKRLSGDDEMKE